MGWNSVLEIGTHPQTQPPSWAKRTQTFCRAFTSHLLTSFLLFLNAYKVIYIHQVLLIPMRRFWLFVSSPAKTKAAAWGERLLLVHAERYASAAATHKPPPPLSAPSSPKRALLHISSVHHLESRSIKETLDCGSR